MSPMGNGIGGQRGACSSSRSVEEERRLPRPHGAYEPPPPPPQQQGGPLTPSDDMHGGSRALTAQQDHRYSRIADDYHTVDEVTQALFEAGLESSNLIVGIDFTRSNEWTGEYSFRGHSLHHIGHTPNPYQQSISIIGQTLSVFGKHNLIPCYGFGDASTRNKDVFSFYPDERPCKGYKEVLQRYKELVPHLLLAGPTSFAPLIEMAMTVVERSGGQHHVLLIIADGQFASIDTESGDVTIQDQKTVDAIASASRNFSMSPSRAPLQPPFGRLGASFGRSESFDKTSTRVQHLFSSPDLDSNVPAVAITAWECQVCFMCLTNPQDMAFGCGHRVCSTCGPHIDPCHICRRPITTRIKLHCHAPTEPTFASDKQDICAVCHENTKDMAFGCGHQTCCNCGPHLDSCPICQLPVTTRIKLY